MWKHEVPSPSERVSLKMRESFVELLDRASDEIRERTGGKAVISRSMFVDLLITPESIAKLVRRLSK